MGGQTHPHSFSRMVFEELPIVATETTVVKKAITKSLARTQLTAAKKKKAKKAAKKPKAKKGKKKKKKKAKYGVGGKRKKGQWKSKASKAGGKRAAAAQKKKGVGLYKPVTLSAALAGITGIKGKTTRGQAIKATWVYIKKKGLNKGRNV